MVDATAARDLFDEHDVVSVYTNHDYEPYARKRDQKISDYLQLENIAFKTYKDQVIFETNEVVKSDGKPYMVYMPYMKVWKKQFFL